MPDHCAPFVSLSKMKKLVFLILLYERMIPELRDFYFSEGRDFSIFQKAREEFWQAMRGSDSTSHWKELGEDILDAAPQYRRLWHVGGIICIECRSRCCGNCWLY